MFRFPVHWLLVLVENVWGPGKTKKQVRNNLSLSLSCSHVCKIYTYLSPFRG